MNDNDISIDAYIEWINQTSGVGPDAGDGWGECGRRAQLQIDALRAGNERLRALLGECLNAFVPYDPYRTDLAKKINDALRN